MMKRTALLIAGIAALGCVEKKANNLDIESQVHKLMNCAETPDVLVVLDKSGSMGQVLPNSTDTKWKVATTAVNNMVTTFHGQLRFGLEIFPAMTNTSEYCKTAAPQVGVGDDTSAAIATAMSGTPASGAKTPLGQALDQGLTYLSGIDSAKSKYVVLVTDGQPNCPAPDPWGYNYSGYAIDRVTALADAGIKTFVIGFGSGVDSTELTKLAEAGQTTSYHQANNSADLEATLSAIAVFVSCCGNGQVDPGEECDDGNTVANDGCSASCTLENLPPVARCQDVTVPADGECKGCASVDNGSYDPNGTPLSVAGDPACPYPLGTTAVTLSVSDGVNPAVQCAASVTVVDQTGPSITCPVAQTLECAAGGAAASFAPVATDNCSVSSQCAPASGSTFPLGTTAATCTATDGAGNSVSCQFNVTVTDTTPPVIACNAPATIGPPDAPIAFAATATDSCGPASVSVQGYDCWAINGAGRRIDKKGACVVRFADNTLTVEDSGGVGDHITWTLSATDGNGNVASTSCEVLVVNPGHGK